MNYEFSPKLTAGFGVGLGFLKPSEGSVQSFLQPAVRATWNPKEKLSIVGQIGVDLRHTEQGDRVTPVWLLTALWEPFDGTAISEAFSNRVRASAALSGRNFTAMSATLTVRQRFFQKIFAILRVGYTPADYYAADFDVPTDREDEYFFIRPSIEFVSAKGWHAEAFYFFRKNDSNIETYAFGNNQVGLEFSVAF